jgi:RHS repeat-associated protein
VQYTYDNIGQLKTAISSVSSENRGYSYDAAWNLNWLTNGTPRAYTVDGKNELTGWTYGPATYDANGNRITANVGMGAMTYSYDDENRLTGVNQSTVYDSAFVYDGLGRLRERMDYTWTGSSWYPNTNVNYIYDGTRVIQERDSSNNPMVSYTRGLDLSGSLEGAGGIGGLLARSSGYSGGNWSTHHFYHDDGNGNITYLVDGSQAMAATYRYDAFGNILSSSGTLASANLYRFSSKEQNVNSGLYIYLYRFYDPYSERWLNREPLGERADMNLYRPMANNTITHFDVDGRIWRTSPAPNGNEDATVICKNGKPVPSIPRSKQQSVANLAYLDSQHGGPGSFSRSYFCYMNCVRQHEQSHIADALAENPNICQGVADGPIPIYVINDNSTDLYKSELKAHEISRDCLQKCKKTCPGDSVDQGIEAEQKWSDKNVFE